MQPGMKSGFTAIETTTKPSIEMKEAAHEAAYSAFARFKCSVVNPKKRTAGRRVGRAQFKTAAAPDLDPSCSFPF
jgi:hypothetical protein